MWLKLIGSNPPRVAEFSREQHGWEEATPEDVAFHSQKEAKLEELQEKYRVKIQVYYDKRAGFLSAIQKCATQQELDNISIQF